MPTLKFNAPISDFSHQPDVERIVEVCANLDHTIPLPTPGWHGSRTAK